MKRVAFGKAHTYNMSITAYANIHKLGEGAHEGYNKYT